MSWLPLTRAQRGLWFAHELDPASPAYTTAEVVDFGDRIDSLRWEAALAAGYREFEQLRCEFRNGPNGPQQRVGTGEFDRLLVIDDLTEDAANAWMSDNLAVPMDISAGEVTRTALLNLIDGRSWWFHAAHHLVADGYGFQLFARRVADHYRGRARDLEPITIEDLLKEQESLPDDTEHWDDQIAQMMPFQTLSGVTGRPAHCSVRSSLAIDVELQDLITAAAQRFGVGWTTVLTSAFSAYLFRLSDRGVEEVRLGVPFMNRTSAERGTHLTARTVCTAMNVLPVATRPGELGVAELVHEVSAQLAVVAAHPWTPQEDLNRVIARQHAGPLFGPQLNLLPFTLSLKLPEATGIVRNLTAGPVDDMTWCVRGMPGRGQDVQLEVDINPSLYPASAASMHAQRLIAWLTTWLGADPMTPVRDLALLSPAEHELVVSGFNRTAHHVKARTLAEAFLDQVAATPDAIAVRDTSTTWTYQDLTDRASMLATALGPDPGAVGVCLPRSVELYAAVYAIWLAGGIYVPLDPDLPEGRLLDMATDAEMTTVITTTNLAGRVSSVQSHVFVDKSLPTAPPSRQASNIAPSPADPAYVLFTSGSTGKPKGVVVSHRAIDNRLAWMQDYFGLTPDDVVLHKTPISFDVSIWELLWPLQVGAQVFVAEPGGHRDPQYLADVFCTEQISTAHFVPSMLRALLSETASAQQLSSAQLRHLICSGEALSTSVVSDAFSVFGVYPVNLYGPTEAAVDVTVFNCANEPAADPVPIGRPIWNTRTYILDDEDRPVPVGAAGHLHLAGVQLADGYLGRPDLTRLAFVSDPFGPGERMYRTGDRARWQADGNIEYLGRIDHQVKIRGQRLELGEVEAVLSRHPLVADVCVVARTDGAGELQLVAFVVSASTDGLDSQLRAHASQHLTEAMIPSRFVALASLPTSSSGKADRAKLIDWDLPADTRDLEVPRNLTEQRVATVMSELLARECGPADDFFLLGGHSLLALRLVHDVSQLTGVSLRLRDIFAHPSARSLAARIHTIEHSGSGGDTELDPVLVLRAPTPGVAPLFALPPAGGLGWCYTGLLQQLPAEQGLIALQSAGMNGVLTAAPASIEEWAHDFWELIEPHLDGPLHLLGWSVGGMVAHAIAAIAADLGVELGVVTLLDAYPSDQWQDLAEPDESEALRGVLRIAGVEAPAGLELNRAGAVELLRASGSAMASLPPATIEASIGWVIRCARLVRESQHPVLDHSIELWRASAPRPETWVDPTGWRKYVSGDLGIHELPVTHGQLLSAPHVHTIAATLARQLAKQTTR